MRNKKRNNPEIVKETPVEEIETVVEETPLEEIETVVEETPVEEKFVKVIANKLNIRKESNKNSEVVIIADKDQTLKLLELDPINGFYHVDTLTGSEGYCMVEFVKVV